MSNFALDVNSSPSDVIGSLNYALANLGNNTGGSATANVLTANTQTGVISTTYSNSGGYAQTTTISYLYQYLNVRYANTATGSSGFSTVPNLSSYFGLQNTTSNTSPSSNPVDYQWTAVSGGFGTTKQLWYNSYGGRQIAFSAANAAPGINFVPTQSNVAIDLDTITGAVANQIVNVNAFYQANTTPATPSGGFYNFATLTLTPPVAWSSTIPGFVANTNVYVSTNVFQGNTTANVAPSLPWTAPAVYSSQFQGNTGAPGERGFVPLGFVLTANTWTTYSNADFTTAFTSSRTSPSPTIGLGFAPIQYDTAQFAYQNLFTGNTETIVKQYDGVGWTTVVGQVVSGGLIVPGTITANVLNANEVYALTLKGGSVTPGVNSGSGFWLTANLGAAYFGGDTTIGNNLIVGANAQVGSNLNVGSSAVIGNNLSVGNSAIIGGFATIGSNVAVGNGLTVGNSAVIGGFATIGSNVAVGTNLTVGNNAVIGGFLNIGANATIGSNLTVGANITVGSNLTIGNNSIIGGFASIGSNVSIGSNLSVGTRLSVGTNATVGTNLTVGNSAVIGGFATIGSNVGIGNGLTVGSSAAIGTNLTVGNNAIIGGFASIGSNVSVGTNLTVGQNATIGGVIINGSLGSGTVGNSQITGTGLNATTVITPNTISTSLIQASAITATQISAGAITAGKIAVGALTANLFTANLIYGNSIIANTLTVSGDINSQNSTVGNYSATGYWLQSSTGSARFGGNVSIGNDLTVGNLITTSTLNANTITTNALVINSTVQSVYAYDDPTVNAIAWVNGNTTVAGQPGYLWPINTRGWGVSGGATIIPTTTGNVGGPKIMVNYQATVSSTTAASNLVELWKNGTSTYYANQYNSIVSCGWCYNTGWGGSSIPTYASDAFYTASGVGGAYYSTDSGATWTAPTSLPSFNGNKPNQYSVFFTRYYSYNGGTPNTYQRLFTFGAVGPGLFGAIGPITCFGTSGYMPSAGSSDLTSLTYQIASGTPPNLYASTPIALNDSGQNNISVGTGGWISRGTSANFTGTNGGQVGTQESSGGVLADLYGIAIDRSPGNSNTGSIITVAVGSGGTILNCSRTYSGGSYSSSTAWSQKVSGVSANLYSVWCNWSGNYFTGSAGSLWVAVGANGALVSSTDGNTWTVRNSGVSADLTGVTYGNGKWIAVGAYGTIITSTDGITWTTVSSGTTRNLTSCAYGPWAQYFVVSGQELIIRSASSSLSFSTVYDGGISAASNLTRLQFYGSFANVITQTTPPGNQQIGNALITGTYTDYNYTAGQSTTYYVVIGNLTSNITVFTGGPTLTVTEYKR